MPSHSLAREFGQRDVEIETISAVGNAFSVASFDPYPNFAQLRPSSERQRFPRPP